MNCLKLQDFLFQTKNTPPQTLTHIPLQQTFSLQQTGSPSGTTTLATMIITQVCSVTENIKNRTLNVFKEGAIGKCLAQIANASIVPGIVWLSSKSNIASIYIQQPKPTMSQNHFPNHLAHCSGCHEQNRC